MTLCQVHCTNKFCLVNFFADIDIMLYDSFNKRTRPHVACLASTCIRCTQYVENKTKVTYGRNLNRLSTFT